MIAALAGAQGGAVSRDQLIALGLGGAAIDHRVRSGKLHLVFRGVYAVGHRMLRREGAWWAAVLAGGEGTLLSHANGAAAWDLRPDPAGRIHITVPDRRRVRHPGLIAHRPRTLTPDERRTCGGIPITSPARTLLDIAGTRIGTHALAAALDRADFLRLLDFAELRGLIERHPTRRGSPALASLLSGYTAGAMVTRSELEERFLALCRRFGLPRPEVNALVEGREVDFVWPRARLIVEVDGYAFHRSPTAFATDRERDVALVLAGYRVLRFTWEQVTQRPSYVARSVRRAFGVI
jgi:hypothetical protein